MTYQNHRNRGMRKRHAKKVRCLGSDDRGKRCTTIIETTSDRLYCDACKAEIRLRAQQYSSATEHVLHHPGARR